MQQRLAIAQALLKKPRILLLDEPFGALDPGIRRDMHELLLALWHETGMTVFMVTHDIAEAFKLGTRLIVFDKMRGDRRAGGLRRHDHLRPAAARGHRRRAATSPRHPAAADTLEQSISILGDEARAERRKKNA